MQSSIEPGTIRIFGGMTAHDTRCDVWTGKVMLPVPCVQRIEYCIDGGNESLASLKLDLCLLSIGRPMEMWSPPEQTALELVGVTPLMLRAARIALWWEVQKAHLQRITRLFR